MTFRRIAIIIYSVMGKLILIPLLFRYSAHGSERGVDI